MTRCAKCGTEMAESMLLCPTCNTVLPGFEERLASSQEESPDEAVDAYGEPLDEAALQQPTRVGLRYIQCTPDGGIRCRQELGSAGSNFVAWVLLTIIGAIIMAMSLVALAVFALSIALWCWLRNSKPRESVLYPAGYLLERGGREEDLKTELGLPLDFKTEKTEFTGDDGSAIMDLIVYGPIASRVVASAGRKEITKLWIEHVRRLDALEKLCASAPQ